MDNINIYKIKTKNINKINRREAKPEPKKRKKTGRFMADLRVIFKLTEIAEITETEPETPAEKFYGSLAEMTEDDIILNEAAKGIRKPPPDIARYLIICVLVGIMAYSGYLLVERLYLYISSQREYDALREMFRGALENTQDAEILQRTRPNSPIQDILYLQRRTGERAVEPETDGRIRTVDRNRAITQSLRAINMDYYGWIEVSHTKISYPMVQTTNNDIYLNRSFEGVRNQSGAIFVDYKNSRDVSENFNTIIYGHNMLDGTMFQPIISFGSRRANFDNGIIEIITEDAKYYYQVFSAREACPYSGYIQTVFESDEEWIEFLNHQQELSNFNNHWQFDADSRIVTLSTCVNDTLRDWRFVVQGVLIHSE